MNVPNHRWHRFHRIQHALLRRYERARSCWVSSTRRELLIDSASLLFLGALCAVIDAALNGTGPTIGALVVHGPLALVALTAAQDVRFFYRDPTYRQGPPDRPSHRAVAVLLALAALWAPVVLRPVLATLWRDLSLRGSSRLLAASERHEWTRPYVMYQTWGPLRVRPELYLAVEVAVALIVFAVAKTWPWTATSITWALPMAHCTLAYS